jgi:4-amino-4-deoxy-L-arabinose transferase-like glycosyltransferase
MNDGKNHIWRIVIVLLLAGILAYLLYWRWQVSHLRFFDVDEFSHLHWAAQLVRGERPYVDFFTYFSPAFMWTLAPLFWFIGVSSQIFIAARVVEFGIFLLLLCVLFFLFGYTRSWRWAILPVIILAFLPMPYDKFLEIRPDTIATLFACFGILTEVVAIEKKGERTCWWWFIAGFFYSLSLVFLLKMVPFVIVGIGIAILVSHQGKTIQNLKAIIVGLLIPMAGLFSWGVFTGTWYVMWRALIIMPFEIFNNLNDYMAPFLLFYPNTSFYGGIAREITIGLVVNHAVWVCGILVGTYRLLTPFVTGQGNRERSQVELLLGLIFFLTIVGYEKFFPAKFAQYLIPVAVFIAYYAADGISLFFEWLVRVGGYVPLVIVMGGFVYVLAAVTQSVNLPKIHRVNVGQLVEFDQLLHTVPLSARVVDLDGRMLFWADGYSVCCLPFDYYLPYIKNAPQSLAPYLATHPADYLYDGNSGRLADLLPENTAYIKSHFAPVPGFGGRLLKRL